MLAVLLVAVIAATPPAPADPFQQHVAAVYDELCLRTFPDDGALDAALAAKGARRLTDAEAKVTLVDDPGRGWTLKLDGHPISVFLELPPYHACSVRFPLLPSALDPVPYRGVVDPFMAAHPGFAPGPSLDRDQGDIHIHATMDARSLPDRSTETLLLVDQNITDPLRRARGETGFMRRFVHQVVTPR